MKNVTVSLQDSVADWVARHQTSVSRMLGDLLAEKMRAEEGYQTAMNEFFAVEPTAISTGSASIKPYPSRDSLHER